LGGPFTGPTVPNIHTTSSSPVLLSTTETRNESWCLLVPRRSRPPGGTLRDMSSSLISHEVPWGAQRQLWPSPGKLLRRVLSEERGERYSPPPKCGHSRATPRGATHTLNCRRCQPSQSTDPHQPAFALGSPVGVGIEGLAGEVESSCSHPREAMNLVHVRRISRRNRTAASSNTP